MADTRHKNADWEIADNTGNYDLEAACLAVLMDIRDELKELNLRFGCPDFLDIPRKLDAIKRNTAKPRRKK